MEIAIKKIEVKLSLLNDEVVEFSIDGDPFGNIILDSKNEAEPATVRLHGGYILGSYHCPHCAIDAISDLYIMLDEAREKSGCSTTKPENTKTITFPIH
ncbi:MAG: DNA breaking-rejoining protein [Serratia sp. (in: enterobacteria)]|uniref:DNA breaking-rejoining protein n=1 Tax=Serratia sp. (in: enterobacteria) TaxID=616 RepID=UPI003F3F3252